MYDFFIDGGGIYLTVLIMHLITVVICIMRQNYWDKTVKEVKCEEISSKLYRLEGRFDMMSLKNHYPLRIVLFKEKESGVERYVFMNNVSMNACKKGNEYALFMDKTKNILSCKDTPRMTRIATYMSIFGFYMGWCILYLIAHFLILKFIPKYVVILNVVAFILGISRLVWYILFDYIFFSFKLKCKYNGIDEEKVKNKASKSIS